MVILIGAGLAWAGSQGSTSGFGPPPFAMAVGLAFLIQWLAFVPAYLRQTEKFYFGEIVLWIGVAIIALPVLRGWQWVALASPIFVALLLTRVSGVPLLERRADEKWGGQQDYEAYKARTPVLVPRL